MSPQLVFSIVSVLMLAAFVVLAVMGFRSTGQATQKPPRGGGRKGRRGQAVPRQTVLGGPLQPGSARPGGARPAGARPGGPGPGEARARRRRDERRVLLPADATVTFAAERRSADIDAILTGLEEDLVGLVPVKKKVSEIAALLLVDRARNKFGLAAPRPNLHMCF
ncbi:MAG TPA: hypothetical protein VLW44_11635, partial [Streptosporangiaceae bacterium]|nr:hypothetical protein [Streptosporangiaceae bacterium]